VTATFDGDREMHDPAGPRLLEYAAELERQAELIKQGVDAAVAGVLSLF
jgi:hypothetical protein